MNIDDALVRNLIGASAGCFSVGAAASLVLAKRKSAARILGNLLTVTGSLFALGIAAGGLAGVKLDVTIPWLLPVVPGGAMFGIDRISAFFVLIIALTAIPSTLFAISYIRDYEDEYSSAWMICAFNCFIACMLLVPLARNIVTFLVLWEGMSLSSYFLVLTEHKDRETRQAAWVYLVMTHAGSVCILGGFLLMSHFSGSANFSEWPTASVGLSAAARNSVFLLLSLGFASKAGVIPLHIWLPKAHPAAPSHVSALMSGVMIKLGVYGLLRVGFEWLGIGPAWWGESILLIGAVSAVVGALYALVDSDLKKLLAYSSVENIGIILLGLGAGMLFLTYHLPALAALALIAALYHTLNHAMFKSLLFLGAGSVAHATGSRNIEELGGLIKRMPQTAVFFLIGSVAIAALPPLNGFVSEWLTFQSLLLSFHVSSGSANLIFVISLAALALTSGLAAACFVRAFGVTFLALPRSERAEKAREVGGGMRTAMALLTAACLALGCFPFAALSVLNRAAEQTIGAPADIRFDWNSVVASGAFASVAPAWIAGLLFLFLAAILIGLRFAGASAAKRPYETWGCGRALQTARFEYTAAAFANPFKRVFGYFYRPVERLEIEFNPESRFFIRTIKYRNEVRSVFDEAVYGRLERLVRVIADKSRFLQSGNIHVYLAYILIALLALLMAAR